MVYSITKNKLIKIFSLIHLIRFTEERIVLEYSKQEIRCPTHLSIGQETVPSILSLFVSKKDLCVSTHRSHAHYIAKGGSLDSFIAELYGRSYGCSNGKGGSMHLIDTKVGFMGSSAIVGNSIPVGLGLGYKFKTKKNNKNFSIVFLGDGAVEEGVFYETLNLACTKKIPTLFICENNQYSVYSPMHVRQPNKRKIYKLSEKIGVESLYCDGNDIDKIYKSFEMATNYIRKFRKPFFIEFSNYRWREHCGPNYDDNLNYRNKKLTKSMIRRDILVKLENYLKKNLRDGEKIIKRLKDSNLKKIDESFLKAQIPEKNISLLAYTDEYSQPL